MMSESVDPIDPEIGDEIMRLYQDGRVHFDYPQRGRVIVSTSLSSEKSALEFQRRAPEWFRPGAMWMLMKSHLIRNVVHGGQSPWKVDITFVTIGWVDEKKAERQERKAGRRNTR